MRPPLRPAVTGGESIAHVELSAGSHPDLAGHHQGDALVFPGVLVLRVRHGKIIHVRDYMDGLGVAHATGRLPAVVRAPG